MFQDAEGEEYLIIFHKIKRPADLSIVERLGGFWCCKGKAFIWIVQGFLQRKCYMGVISTHSSLGINPSIVPFSDEKLIPMAMSLRLSAA